VIEFGVYYGCILIEEKGKPLSRRAHRRAIRREMLKIVRERSRNYRLWKKCWLPYTEKADRLQKAFFNHIGWPPKDDD
jgi:hypothetical protein